MRQFIARARLFDETKYYNSIWRINDTGWTVEFIQGKNMHRKFPSHKVIIAQDEEWKMNGRSEK